MSEHIAYRKEGPVGWLIFNDPAHHNAITIDMAEAVPPVMEDFERDDSIRVVVVTGAGERAFAAGSNISTFGAVRSDPEQNRHYHRVNERAYDAVYECCKPTIAMIRGYCIGGGLDFAASCDIRICAADASFSIPAGRLGVGYGYEGQLRLLRIVSPARARDIFFSARRYSAVQALEMGLVHEVIEADALQERVGDYAALVAGHAPLTLRALKQAFLEVERDAHRIDLPATQAMIDACFTSEDYQEGRNAFAQKRTPVFRGR